MLELGQEKGALMARIKEVESERTELEDKSTVLESRVGSLRDTASELEAALQVQRVGRLRVLMRAGVHAGCWWGACRQVDG